MGSPDFSVPALEQLVKEGHEIVAVYCQPPRAKNRGHHLHKVAVHQMAEKLSLPVYTPTSLKKAEVQEEFKSHQADLAVVAAYGLILPLPILETPKFGCINIHASLLPRWRGAAPIHRSILAGDQETGITIMQMDEGLDTGDILSMASMPITADTTVSSLHDQLSSLGSSLLLETLSQLERREIKPIKQPEVGVTYAHKLSKEEGELKWEETAAILERKIRALNPWPGTWFEHKGNIIKIHKASLLKENFGEVGQFLITDKNTRWLVQCNEGSLSLELLQKPGGKFMETADFLRGYQVF